MAKQRSTFAKLQRDLDKKAKAAARVEKRANRAAAAAESDEPELEMLDESVVIEEMAKLQAALEDGTLSMDEFQSRRETLTSRLKID